tara:strand:- start:28 stop:1083 length:1056 start_codon:yes stop_codon:yes gene_type:complete
MSNKNSYKNQKVTYTKSGVSIKVADKLVEKIKPISKKTFDKNVLGNIGGFGALYDFSKLKYKNPVLVSGTDGVGTKLKIAVKTDNLKGIGVDLVAMCVNDIISQGAKPLFFLDYYATSKLNLKKSVEILKGIAKGCKQSECALIGGETAEMPGLYKKNDFDLAGFCVGVVDKKDILPKKNIKKTDVIIGLKSSGFHSNGYSLINFLINKKKLNLKKKINNTTYEKILIKPTKLYTDILKLRNFKDIKAIANITGGGMTENIPRVLPKNMSAEIDLNKIQLPAIFKEIKNLGNIDYDEMLRVFNCGIGMIIIVSKTNADKTMRNLKSLKLSSKIIGEIVPLKGNPKVKYKNK